MRGGTRRRNQPTKHPADDRTVNPTHVFPSQSHEHLRPKVPNCVVSLEKRPEGRTLCRTAPPKLLDFLERGHDQRHGDRAEQRQVHGDLVLVREVDLSDHGPLEESLLGLGLGDAGVLERAAEAALAQVHACLSQVVDRLVHGLGYGVGDGDGR